MSLVERIQALSVERKQRILTYYQSLPVPATCELFTVRKLLAVWIEKYTLFNGINTDGPENCERVTYWNDSFISLIRAEITRHKNEPGFMCVKLSSTLDHLMTLKPEQLFMTFKECVTKELDEHFEFLADSLNSLAPTISEGKDLMPTFSARLKNLQEAERDNAQYIQNRTLAEQTKNFDEVRKLDLVLEFSIDAINMQVSTLMNESMRERCSEVEGQLNNIMSRFLEMTSNLITNLEAIRNLFPPNDFQASGLKILNLNEFGERYDDFLAKILQLQENLENFQQFLDSFTDSSRQPMNFVIRHKSFIAKQLSNVQRIFNKMAKQSLILETQPGNTIQKNRNFNVTVKCLAPKALKLNISTIKLKPTIISDHMASNLIQTENLDPEAREGCGDTKHKKSEVSCANFSVQFQDMKIPTRPKDESIPQRSVLKYKFHLLFYADVKFMGKTLTLWTLSIPFVFILNTSQLPLANLTIFWDVYLKEGNSAEGPEKVTVERLTQAFNSYIQTETLSDSWNLTETQKKCLVEKLLKKKNPSNDEVVFRNYFEKVGDSKVKFWKWFFGSVGLIKRHLNPFWKKGFIVGYLPRDQAETMIANSPLGTFLVRFSDTSEGSISITWKHNEGPASVQPLTEKYLAIQNITDRVHNINFFSNVICPYDNSLLSKTIAFPPSSPPINSLPQFGRRSRFRPYLKHFVLWSILLDW